MARRDPDADRWSPPASTPAARAASTWSINWRYTGTPLCSSRQKAKDRLPRARDADRGVRRGQLPANFGGGEHQRSPEIAASDISARMKDLERGGEPACPDRYVVWAQGSDGGYRQVSEIIP
jgi:hypothetical protein